MLSRLGSRRGILTVAAAGASVVAGAAFVVSRQRKLLYMPTQDVIALPSDFGTWITGDDVAVTAADGVTTRSWLISPSSSGKPGNGGEQRPLLVYFHGNAGNISHRLPAAAELVEHVGCRVLLCEYRGYGLSDAAEPTERGLVADATAVLAEVARAPDLHAGGVWVFGRSLGGAVAVAALSASDGPCRPRPPWLRGLLLENTFTSVPDMAGVVLPTILSRVFSPFIWDTWCTADRIAGVDLPMLLMSGQRDEIVPPTQMDGLRDIARAGSDHHVAYKRFPGGTHNDTWCQPGYCDAVAAFLRDTRVKEISSADGRSHM